MCSKNKYLYGLLPIFIIVVASCRKPEKAITPADRGGVVAASVDVSSDYRQQVFYSLSQNAIVSSNLKTAWDLAFTCDGTNTIRLNTSKWMAAFNTGVQVFTDVTDTTGFGAGKAFDSPTGNVDSLAVSNWQQGSVFIVDRGFSYTGTLLGLKKLQVVSVNANAYNLKIANVDGSNEVSVTLTKDPAQNFVYLSFDTNTQVTIEPEKENYDLVFTQYTHIYTNPFETYLVMGVLINPTTVSVSQVFDVPFSSISISDTLTHPLRQAFNIIGFDWKTYNFSSSTYVVNAGQSYIIRDAKGFYYKLHFIDFYNASGLKGCPKFEFQKL